MRYIDEHEKVTMAARQDKTVSDVGKTPLEKYPDPDLGNDVIPKERYTSAEFMQQEWENIWTKVWLMGALEQDLREPGDYVVTEIGRESILIVRQQDGGVRAFYNVCQHRGNLLRPKGLGSTESFQCAYHHWEYHLDGSFKRIPDEETFPQGRPCAGLEEIPCDTWGSWVWFSLNPDVEPLKDYLEEIPQHLDPYHFERMALTRDVTVEWDCNWKASVDAFNESYHVQGIHPQLLYHLDDINLQIDCFNRHNRYLIPFVTVSPRITPPNALPEGIKMLMKDAGMDPADYEGKVTDVRRDLQKWKRENGPKQGKDYSDLHDEQLTDDYHYLIFPSVTLNTHADDYWLFRQRPHATDPNKMYFDIMTFELVPEGEEWPERPEHMEFKHGEKSIGLVLNQDAYNLPGVQHGMLSRGFRGLWIGDQELRIRHFHKVIDDYIYGPGEKPEGAL
ncbi:MAG: aromatic ring-hydroxylating dioxygenase subunit alpha [Gammaproteobacteria bacterium]